MAEEVEEMFQELEGLRGASTEEDRSRVEAFKKVAPTRPHPNVPNEPLAGGPASLLDRMRDLATGRGS